MNVYKGFSFWIFAKNWGHFQIKIDDWNGENIIDFDYFQRIIPDFSRLIQKSSTIEFSRIITRSIALCSLNKLKIYFAHNRVINKIQNFVHLPISFGPLQFSCYFQQWSFRVLHVFSVQFPTNWNKRLIHLSNQVNKIKKYIIEVKFSFCLQK